MGHLHVAGRQHRESTITRSWRQATVYAHGVELRYERILAGEKPKPKEPCTVQQAVSAYLEDKRSQCLARVTVQKLEHCLRDSCSNGAKPTESLTSPIST